MLPRLRRRQHGCTRRQLHALLKSADYDPMESSAGIAAI